LKVYKRPLLVPEVVDYALGQFEKELGHQLQSLSGQMDASRRRKVELEAELRRLTSAVAKVGDSCFLLEAIVDHERELRGLTDRLLSGEPGSIQASLADLRQFVHSRLSNVKKLLYSDVEHARLEPARRVSRITMRPVETAGQRHYIASGEWGLLGEGFAASGGGLEMVAGAGFEPATFGL
jgi:hypothetical protein